MSTPALLHGIDSFLKGPYELKSDGGIFWTWIAKKSLKTHEPFLDALGIIGWPESRFKRLEFLKMVVSELLDFEALFFSDPGKMSEP